MIKTSNDWCNSLREVAVYQGIGLDECSETDNLVCTSTMATISKDSIAQFWLHAFPNSSETEKENYSFSDPKVVSNLLRFTSENNKEKKVFALIHADLEQTQVKRIIKTTNKIVTKRQLQCQINIEVLQIADDEEEEEVEVPKTINERTIENLSSLLHESDSTMISKQFQTFIYPWLIDVSFHLSNEFFTIIVDLMNKYPEEFFLHCFVPWLNETSIDNLHLFCSNLYSQLIKITDRCQLCTYLCENSTRPLNANQLSLISRWFDSKEFYFSNDLASLLPAKIAISAQIFSADLPFAKVLHKILIKCTENPSMLSNDQRAILKQAITINTTILSDILMDLLD